MRFLVLFFCPILCLAQSNCDLKRDADGIRVYTCKEQNEKFKSLRAEFELPNITTSQLKTFLWDVENYQTWQYNLMEAHTVDTVTLTTLAYRALIDAPWPVDNREIVVKMRIHETPGQLAISIQTHPYLKQPPDGFIRVPFFEATWTVVKQSHALKITYALRIDPGGSVPAWLVNIAMADGPYVSFKNLKQLLSAKPR